MDPTKITRKNKFGSLAFKSSRLLPANTTRAVGRSKPIGHAHEEKVRNLSHPPLSARTHACDCTTQDPGLTPHLLRLKQARHPPQWHRPKGRRDVSPALCLAGTKRNAVRSFGPWCASKCPASFQCLVQTSSYPSFVAGATHRQRDKAATNCSHGSFESCTI